jgi:hypothetical protein
VARKKADSAVEERGLKTLEKGLAHQAFYPEVGGPARRVVEDLTLQDQDVAPDWALLEEEYYPDKNQRKPPQHNCSATGAALVSAVLMFRREEMSKQDLGYYQESCAGCIEGFIASTGG